MLKELTLTQTYNRVLVHLALFIALMFILNQNASYAQEMQGINISPSFTGGKNALKEFILNNLRYPDEARKIGLSGIVEVKFMINHEGKVEDAKIMKGINSECDAEAIRLTNLITGWSPGIRQGKPVNTFVILPIEFKGPNKLHPSRITGKIIEETTGLPLEGIFIIVKGTNIGSVSGTDGSYILEVPSEAKYLECFGVGYSLKEVEIDSHSTINIELDPEYVILDFEAPGN
jgi:protein TonB